MQSMFNLSRSQTNRLIDQAVRHQATVSLEPCGWLNGKTLEATLHGCDDRALLIEAVTADDEVLESLVGMHVDVGMQLGGSRYRFDTHVMDIEEAEARFLLLLARPETFQVNQRRRFRRVALKSTSHVHLSSKHLGDSRQATARLLNLSPEGVACRTRKETAALLSVGDWLHLAFHPQEAELPFEFKAMLASKSQAGSKGYMILGLQFHCDPDDSEAHSARQRLSEFLYDSTPAAATQEGTS